MDYTHGMLLTDIEIVNRQMDLCGSNQKYSAVKIEDGLSALDRWRKDTPVKSANILDGSLANICVGAPERCAKLMYMDAFCCLSQMLQRTEDERS